VLLPGDPVRGTRHDGLMASLEHRLLHTWALNQRDQALALVATDPSWQSAVHDVAGGWLVLSGAGMYVNRALAVGVDAPLGDDELDRIVELSAARGLPPAVEVSPATHPATVELLARRGFARAEDSVTAFTLSVADAEIAAPLDVVVRPVVSADDLLLWQETSAIGWGHTQPEGRRASDAFAAAAHVTDGAGMVIAFDGADGRPLGCASTTVRGGVATLGGMSTAPAERRRGVQAALLRHRIGFAAEHGCDLATATAVTGGASGRNLERHGFAPRFRIDTFVQS
jgi:GNAT superfamily N-acetyltransferase